MIFPFASYLSVLFGNFFSSASRVAVSVKSKDSRGTFSMNGPINVASQGNGVALDIYPAIGLVKAPVRIQTPQEAVVSFRRGCVLLRAGAFDFGDSGAARNGCGMGAVDDKVLDFVFGIEDDGDDVSFF